MSARSNGKRSRGSVLLARWLKKNEVSLSELAEQAECSKTAAGFLRKGELKPGLDLAVRISKITKGAVPPESWTKLIGRQ